jgi:hypothetical protein
VILTKCRDILYSYDTFNGGEFLKMVESEEEGLMG